MMRRIINIDSDKCNGCGLCVDACHEGAIALINGKAKLVREDHCDGLGDCLPACPAGAIAMVTREALAYDEEHGDGVPLVQARSQKCDCIDLIKKSGGPKNTVRWPIQMKLLPLDAAFLKNADILVSADCCAYVRADFHNEAIKDRVILIGCPKLDKEDYAQRLSAIFEKNGIRSVTLARMDIPCCMALARMVREALASVKKEIPLNVIVYSTDGKIVTQ